MAGATTSPAGWSASPMPPRSARLDRSKYGLRRLKLAEKYGLVWVVPTALEDNEDTSLDIEGYLGALNADLSGWDMQGWELHSSEPIRPRMNWKLVIDTFLELYHFRYLHPGTRLSAVPGQHRHLRAAWASTCAGRRGQARLDRAGGASPKESWRIRDHAIVFYSAVSQHRADLHPGSLRRVLELPDLTRRSGLASLGAGRRRRRQQSPKSYWKANVDLFANALVEDLAHRRDHPEQLQERRQPQQTFGKFEKALGWYHGEIDKALSAEKASFVTSSSLSAKPSKNFLYASTAHRLDADDEAWLPQLARSAA